jgi:Ring finger domain
MSTLEMDICEIILTHRSRCDYIEGLLQQVLEMLDRFAGCADPMPEAAVEHHISVVVGLIRRIQRVRQIQRDNDVFAQLSPDTRTLQRVEQFAEQWFLLAEFLETNADQICLHYDILQQALVDQDMGQREMTAAAATTPRDVPQCSVCFEPEDAKATIILLPCGHWFHCACAVRWVHTQHTCPVCRARVSSLADCEFHETGSAE